MIQKYVDIFMANKQRLRDGLTEHPSKYVDLVRKLVTLFHEGSSYGEPDPGGIHVIDDGDYQGTQLFIIPEDGYQPSKYWMMKVEYGSCSSCDTLERIRDSGDGTIGERQKDDYLTLMLHLVQSMKEITVEDASDE